jgi:hypothetical protein
LEVEDIEWDKSKQLRFNMVGRIQIDKKIEFAKMISLVDKLCSESYHQENRSAKFTRVSFDLEKADDFTKETLSNLIVNRYVRQVQGEERDVVFFWFYPHFLIMNGRRTEISKAIGSFRFGLFDQGVKFTLQQPMFEWYYFLGFFEKVAARRQWLRNRDILDTSAKGPSTEIAQGVRIVSIHDVSSVGEIDPTQAQSIIAKGSGDATQDLSTGVSFLEGRKPTSVLIYGTVDEKPVYVRLFQGGRLHVLKRNLPDDASYSSDDSDMERLSIGLQFSKRIIKAYFDWSRMPVDKMLPTGEVYKHIHKSVESRITPLLNSAVSERLEELKVIRKDLKRKQKRLSSKSSG